MTRTDVEEERIIGTFMISAGNIRLGEDEVYQDEVDVPILDRADLVLPDLEFMLRHEPGNYLPPLAEQRDDSLVAVGNNTYLEAIQRTNPSSWTYFHLTRPLSGLTPMTPEKLREHFGAYGPINEVPDQTKDRKTFLFLEDRNRLHRSRTRKQIQQTLDGTALNMGFKIHKEQGAIEIYNTPARLDVEAQTKLMGELPKFYASLEERFGPIRSINGERRDN